MNGVSSESTAVSIKKEKRLTPTPEKESRPKRTPRRKSSMTNDWVTSSPELSPRMDYDYDYGDIEINNVEDSDPDFEIDVGETVGVFNDNDFNDEDSFLNGSKGDASRNYSDGIVEETMDGSISTTMDETSDYPVENPADFCESNLEEYDTILANYDEEIREELKKIIIETKTHTCFLCKKVNKGPYALKMHLCIHFVEELQEFNPDGSRLCPFCDHLANCDSDIWTHIGMKHDKLKEILPKEIADVLYHPSIIRQKPTTSKQPIEMLNVDKETAIKMIKENTCHLCGRKFSLPKHMARHMTVVHFKSQLEGKYPPLESTKDNKFKCPTCKVWKSTSGIYFYHIGAVHNYIEEFMDKDIAKELLSYKGNSQAPIISEPDPSKTFEQQVIDLQKKRCHICERKSKSMIVLQNHMSNSHYRNKIVEKFPPKDKKEDDHQCPICDKWLSTYWSYIAHVGAVHQIVKEFMGEKLGKVLFDDPVQFQDTMTTPLLTDPDPSKCLDDQVADIKEKKCHICGKETQSPYGLQCHLSYSHYRVKIKTKYQPMSRGREKQQCPLCEKMLQTSASYIVHIGAVHQKLREFIDEKLSEELFDDTVLNSTLTEPDPSKSLEDQIADIKELRCHICSKEVATANKLQGHLSHSHYRVKIQNKFEPLRKKKDAMQCKFCEKWFSASASYIIHIGTVHQKLKEFIDEKISSELFDDSILSMTLTEPDPSKPLEDQIADIKELRCHICAKKVTAVNVLQNHISSSHYKIKIQNKYQPMKKMKDRYQCKLCEKWLGSSFSFIVHMGGVHQKLRDFINENLSKELFDETLKNITLTAPDPSVSLETQISNVKDKMCHICGKQFKVMNQLNIHLACAHYKKRISEKFPPLKKRGDDCQCRICERMLSSIYIYNQHMGTVHQILKEFVHEDLSKVLYDENSQCYGQIEPDASKPIEEQVENIRSRSCYICGRQFKMMCMLINHLAGSHMKNKILEKFPPLERKGEECQCQFCNNRLSSVYTYTAHLGTVHQVLKEILQDELWKALYENTQVHSVHNLTEPDPSKSLDDQVNDISNKKCHICDKPFQATFILYNHISTTHYGQRLLEKYPPAERKGDEYKCSLCGKWYSSKSVYAKHLGSVHQALKGFIDEKLSHLLYDDSIQVHSANILTDPDPSRSLDDQVNDIKNKKCHICDKTFPAIFYLYNHISTSHYRKRILEKYPPTERKGDEYKCSLCGKWYSSKSVYAKHLGSVHQALKGFIDEKLSHLLYDDTTNKMYSGPTVLTEPDPSKSIEEQISDVTRKQCHICGRECKGMFMLKHHLSSTHFKTRIVEKYPPVEKNGDKHKCPLCLEWLGSVYTYAAHVGITHKISKECMDKGVADIVFDELRNKENTNADVIPELSDEEAKDYINKSSCFICGKNCRKLNPLKTHLLFPHFAKQIKSDHPPKDTEGDKKQCPICTKWFDSTNMYVFHVGLTHKTLKKYLPENFAKYLFNTTSLTHAKNSAKNFAIFKKLFGKKSSDTNPESNPLLPIMKVEINEEEEAQQLIEEAAIILKEEGIDDDVLENEEIHDDEFYSNDGMI